MPEIDSRDFMAKLFAGTINNPNAIAIPGQYLSDATNPYFKGGSDIPWKPGSMTVADTRQWGAPETGAHIATAPAAAIPTPTTPTPPVTPTPAPVTPGTPATPAAPTVDTAGMTSAKGLYSDVLANQFTFSPEYQNVAKILGDYAPSTFDYAGLNKYAQTPVQFTPEEIQNKYAGVFSDLQRQEAIDTQRIKEELKKNMLGRSGEVMTSLGDLASEYSRQRQNTIQNVLSELLYKQEELSQGRVGLGLQGESTRQGGYNTAANIAQTLSGAETTKEGLGLQSQNLASNIISNLMGSEYQQAGLTQEKELTQQGYGLQERLADKTIGIEEKKLDLQKYLGNKDFDIQEKTLALQETLTNKSLSLQERELVINETLKSRELSLAEKAQAVNEIVSKGQLSVSERTLTMNELNSQIQRSFVETEKAIANGNYELAKTRQKDELDALNTRVNLEAQSQGYTQNVQKMTLLLNSIQMMLTQYQFDEATRTELIEQYKKELLALVNAV